MLLEQVQQTEFRAGYKHFWSQFSFMIAYILQVAYPGLQRNSRQPDLPTVNASSQVFLDCCLFPGIRLFSGARALALFFGETSPAKGGELFLAEESAAEDGEFPFSWLFLSREKNSGFANDLVHGHLRGK